MLTFIHRHGEWKVAALSPNISTALVIMVEAVMMVE